MDEEPLVEGDLETEILAVPFKDGFFLKSGDDENDASEPEFQDFLENTMLEDDSSSYPVLLPSDLIIREGVYFNLDKTNSTPIVSF